MANIFKIRIMPESPDINLEAMKRFIEIDYFLLPGPVNFRNFLNFPVKSGF